MKTEYEQELLQNALQDKQFVEGIFSMNAEEVRDAFMERGIDFSTEEINRIAEMANEMIASEELDENALEGVAGGSKISKSDVCKGVAVAMVAVGCGVGIMLSW